MEFAEKSIVFSLVALLAAHSASAQERSVVSPQSAQDRGIIESSRDTTVSTLKQTRDGLGDAALAPLEDLNLRRDAIPGLITDLKTPYDPLPDFRCETIASEVRKLDTVLENDVDVQLKLAQDNIDTDPKLSERASDFALDQVSSEARSFIPFRGIIRQATGAASHAKKLQAAYDTARHRRSYLKGIGAGRGCTYPAAPYPISMDSLTPDSAPIRYDGSHPLERPQPQASPTNLIPNRVGSSDF